MTGRANSWWQDFFNQRSSLDLSRFPDAEETQREVAGLIRILKIRGQQRIADVCCGYGRHVVPLAQRGHIVFGIDIAPLMLAKARRWLEKDRVQAFLVRADARQLPFADNLFDVVLNLFNSFGYCESEADNQRILTESARVWRQTENGPVVHQASIRLYGIDELDEMMAAAGLRKTAIYGDYEATPFAGYQRQVLYLAEKPVCR